MKHDAGIEAALTTARPQAVSALLRYFRDLDTAEEAFQEASLRALKNWPEKGPAARPWAWLIFVGRNAALDEARRRSKQQALPDDDLISDLEDTETAVVEGLDSHTIATTCCGCSSSAATPNCQQTSRSRWRCASFRACR